MCDVIRHRGPDDEGVLVDEGVGARHAAAEHHRPVHRPAADSQRRPHRLGRVQRRDLQLPGAAARARGARPPLLHDRPTPRSIVHAYEEWGTGRHRAAARHVRPGDLGHSARGRCCSRATASASSRCTTRRATAGLYFGSEIKSLLCAPDLPRDLDLDALDHYLSFLYTPRDGSIFANVQKLPPGHLLTWQDGAVDDRAVLATAGDGNVQRVGGGRRLQQLRDRPGRCRAARTWSATCRSARFSPAASTRASSSA